MNEMASQVIDGAVSQLQVLEIYSFLRGYHAYTEMWNPVMGEIYTGGEDRTNEQTLYTCSGNLQRYRNCRPCSIQSSSKNVSIFYERTKHSQKSLEPKSTSKLEVPCVYHPYGPNIYVDKMKGLVESLLADGHYNLCNSDFAQCFLVNGCGQLNVFLVNGCGQ